ncbi:17 kDa surface antigen [Pandoraea terrae]|uniref:17 kDa surface antigen n=1 Tax=Pandoraea terrae TaxID=1537710 RepID=A0A5E4VNN4_9BURK|nr:glycine zipper 2TM domain-containing protein [Pandoraea terrae]VVE14027.1 17 kDa surface antigen [Pandoraea terrae]
MDNNLQPRRMHPLVAAAAGSVILVSLVGVAAITGVLPHASSTNAPATQGLSAEQQAQQAQAEQQQALQAQQAQQAQQAEQAKQAQAAEQAYEARQRQAEAAPARRGSVPRPPQTAQQAYPSQAYPSQRQAAACASCGTVSSIEPIKIPGQATGIGAVGGAVAGGLLGNQFGAGNGRTAMTVVGALGGGLAGNAVEKNVRSDTEYRVNVRMDNGSTRYFTYKAAPGVQPGDRVRIENGGLVRAS